MHACCPRSPDLPALVLVLVGPLLAACASTCNGDPGPGGSRPAKSATVVATGSAAAATERKMTERKMTERKMTEQKVTDGGGSRRGDGGLAGFVRGLGSAGDGDGGAGEPPSSVVKAPLPETVLESIVGCWQLDDSEQWTITRTEQGGARVVRKILLPPNAVPPDYAERATAPSEIMYDPGEGTFAFLTAGPRHAVLSVFRRGPEGLEARFASSRAPGAPFHWLNRSASLRPCANESASGRRR